MDGSPTEDQMCLGRIATAATFSRFMNWEDGNVTVTSLPDAETLEICRPARLMALLALSRL